jgi:hypothetical protein
MSAAVIVAGVAEGLQLLDNLIQAASQVSTAINQAQATGTALNLTPILSAEAQAENAVLAAIAAQKGA